MSRLRVPIAGLMAAVLLVALDAAVVRSLLASDYNIPTSPTTTINAIVFAFGVLPMANLLALVGLIVMPGLLRRGGTSSYFVGFEALGWAAVFAFIALSALSPSSVAGYANGVFLAFAPAVRPLFEAVPEWVGAIFELVACAIVFGLPELLVALAGGWLARRSGLSVSFESRQPVAAGPPGSA